MSNIGILGGSFNPIHKAHLFLAQELLENKELDKVIFVPTYIQPFKDHSCSNNSKHRLKMIEIAIEEYPNMEVSDWEIKQKNISYTYLTLSYFKNLYKDDNIFFVSGADTFLKIQTWKYGIKLLENNNFIVANRPSVCCEKLKTYVRDVKEIYNTNVRIFNNQELDISSTEIRENISKTMESRNKLFEKVDEYIQEHGLYKNS